MARAIAASSLVGGVGFGDFFTFLGFGTRDLSGTNPVPAASP